MDGVEGQTTAGEHTGIQTSLGAVASNAWQGKVRHCDSPAVQRNRQTTSQTLHDNYGSLGQQFHHRRGLRKANTNYDGAGCFWQNIVRLWRLTRRAWFHFVQPMAFYLAGFWRRGTAVGGVYTAVALALIVLTSSQPRTFGDAFGLRRRAIHLCIAITCSCLLVAAGILRILCACSKLTMWDLHNLGYVGLGSVGIEGPPGSNDHVPHACVNPFPLLPEVTAVTAGVVGVVLSRARASTLKDSALFEDMESTTSTWLKGRCAVPVSGILLLINASVHCNLFSGLYVLALTALVGFIAQNKPTTFGLGGTCLLWYRRFLCAIGTVQVIFVMTLSAPNLLRSLPSKLLILCGVSNVPGALFTQTGLAFAMLTILGSATHFAPRLETPTHATLSSPTRRFSASSCSPRSLTAVPTAGSLEPRPRLARHDSPAPLEQVSCQASPIQRRRRASSGDRLAPINSIEHVTLSSATEGMEFSERAGSRISQMPRRRGISGDVNGTRLIRTSSGKSACSHRPPRACHTNRRIPTGSSSSSKARRRSAFGEALHFRIAFVRDVFCGSLALPVFSAMLWALLWPSAAAIPILLWGFILFHVPTFSVPTPAFTILLVYQIVFGLTMYGYNIYRSMVMAPPSAVPQAFTWEEKVGFQSYTREGAASHVLAHAWYVCLQALAVLASAVSVRARQKKPADLNWILGCPRIMPFTRNVVAWARPLTVVFVLSLALSQTCFSLLGFGYVIWILLLVVVGNFRPYAEAGWDVLRGSTAVWHVLLLYSNALVAALLVWQVWATGEQKFVGLSRTEISLIRILWPHIVISLLATVQCQSLRGGILQPSSLVASTSPLTSIVWVGGMFCHMGVVFLVVMVPPKSIDSLVFLLLYVGTVAIEQIDCLASVWRTRMLAMTGFLAALLMPVRYAILLPAVQDELSKVPLQNTQKSLWDSFAFEADVRIRVKLFLLIMVLILSVALRRLYLNPRKSDAVDNEAVAWLSRLNTAMVARAVKEAARWSMSTLMFIAFFLMLKYDAASVFQIAMLLLMLVKGRHWEYAGPLISVCSMTLLLAQYWYDLQYVRLESDMKSYWGLTWEWKTVRMEVALLFLGIVQRSVQRAARHLKDDKTCARQASAWRRGIRRELAGHGAHISAILLVMLSLFRTAASSVAFMFIVLAFRLSGDLSRTLKPTRTNSWLRLMGTAQAISLLFRIAVAVWLPPDFIMDRPGPALVGQSGVCVWAEDSLLVSRLQCGSAWLAWLELSDERTSYTFSFSCLFITALLRHICLKEIGACQHGDSVQEEFANPAKLNSQTNLSLSSGHVTDNQVRSSPHSKFSQPHMDHQARRVLLGSMGSAECCSVSLSAGDGVKRASSVVSLGEKSQTSPSSGERPNALVKSVTADASIVESVSSLQLELAVQQRDIQNIRTVTGSEVDGNVSVSKFFRGWHKSPAVRKLRAKIQAVSWVAAANPAAERAGWIPHIVYGSTAVFLWFCLACAALSQPQASVITLGYMLLLFVHLITSESTQTLSEPFESRCKCLGRIRNFNILVCFLSVLFQCPNAPCPWEKSSGEMVNEHRKWWTDQMLLTPAQCVQLQRNFGDEYDDDYKSSVVSIILKSSGFRKHDKGVFFDLAAFWHLMVFVASLAQSLACTRWPLELKAALTAQGDRFALRESRYIEHLVRWRRWELSRVDTKHKVLLLKLDLLIRYLHEVRAVWANERSGITDEERELHEHETRQLDICLRTGAKQDEVHQTLVNFEEMINTLLGEKIPPAVRGQIVSIVDEAVVNRIERSAMLQLQKISEAEDERSLLEIMQRCKNDVLAIVDELSNDSLGGVAEIEPVPEVECSSDLEAPMNKISAPTNAVGAKKSSASDAFSQVWTTIVVFIKDRAWRAYEAIINDFLFMREGDDTLSRHRRTDGALALLAKALMSQTLFFLFLAAMLQFVASMTVFAAVTMCAIVLSLMAFPHAPPSFWKGLQVYNLTVIFVKMIYQLPNIATPDVDNFRVPWQSVLGLLKVVPLKMESQQPNFLECRNLAQALWADLLLCAFLFCHWHALRQSGHLGDPGAICQQLLEEDRLENTPDISEYFGQEFASQSSQTLRCEFKDAGIRLEPPSIVPKLDRQVTQGSCSLGETPPRMNSPVILAANINDTPKSKDSVYVADELDEECGSLGSDPDLTDIDDADEDSEDVSENVSKRILNVLTKLALGGVGLRKPAMDVYNLRLGLSVIILLIAFLLWKPLTNSKRSFSESVANSVFSGQQVVIVTLVLGVIVQNRAEYTWYTQKKATPADRSNHHPCRQHAGLSYVPRSPASAACTTDGTETVTRVGSHGFRLRASSVKDASSTQDAPSATLPAIQLVSNSDSVALDELQMQTSVENAEARPPISQLIAPLLQKTLLLAQLIAIHAIFMGMWTTSTESTRSPTMTNPSQLLLYAVYIAYLALTSLQLKYDVHVVRGGLALTHSTDLLTNIAFKGYIAVPFVEELRVLADWTVTKTSLDFFMWMKLEDAHQNLYRTTRDMLVRRTVPRATPRPAYEKVFQGGFLLVALVALIVGPIVFFSTLNPSLKANAVVRATLKAEICVDSTDIGEKTTMLYQAGQKKLTGVPVQSDRASSASNGDDEKDVYEIQFPDLSDSFWLISPSLREQMGNLLNQSASTTRIRITCDLDLKAGETSMTAEAVLAFKELDSLQTEELLSVWTQAAVGGTQIPLALPQSFQTRVHVDSSLQPHVTGMRENATLKLIFHGDNSGAVVLPVWQLQSGGKGNLQVIVITERIAPKFGSSGGGTSDGGAGSGVIALYLGVVYTIGRFLRMVFQDSSKRIIYEELPDTTLLLDLCNGIYIARIQGFLEMEYKLYYQLIQIYRSPELLLDVSRAADFHTDPNGGPDDEEAPHQIQRAKFSRLGQLPAPIDNVADGLRL